MGGSAPRRTSLFSRLLPAAARDAEGRLDQIIFIDYENVQRVDLSRWTGDPAVRVRVYLGRNQKTMSAEFVRQAQVLGNRLEYVNMEGEGKNHLDFHIAFDLGRFHSSSPEPVEFAVVSNDRGFDGMLRSLRKLGRKVRRLGPGGEEKDREREVRDRPERERERPERERPERERSEREKVERERPEREKSAPESRAEAPDELPEVSAPTAKILENIGEIAQARRPKKRSTLENHIDSVFKPLGGNYSVASVMEEMLEKGLIAEGANQRITYHF
jgi:hypothetical protein